MASWQLNQISQAAEGIRNKQSSSTDPNQRINDGFVHEDERVLPSVAGGFIRIFVVAVCPR